MANGLEVHEGAAACGSGLNQGTRFIIRGDPNHREYVCEDTGLGPELWVDIFFWDEADGWAWIAQVGDEGSIEAVRPE